MLLLWSSGHAKCQCIQVYKNILYEKVGGIKDLKAIVV